MCDECHEDTGVALQILSKAKYDLILKQQEQHDPGFMEAEDGWNFKKVPVLKFEPCHETNTSPLCKELEAKAFNQVCHK